MKSSYVAVGQTITAKQYNDLRRDAYISSFFEPQANITLDRTIIINSGIYLTPEGEIVQFDRTRTGDFEDPIQFDRIDLVSYDRWKNELVITSGVEAVTPSIPETPADMKPICAVRFRVSGNKILDTDDDDGIEHYIYKDLRKKFIPTLIKATDADIKAGVDDLKYVTCSGLQQAIQFFDLNFTIQGYRANLFAPRRVLWSVPYDDVSGIFRVYRKEEASGTYSEVASYSVSSGVMEYIDNTYYDGDVYFYVAYTSDSIYQETKEIIFKNSSLDVPIGYFGEEVLGNYYDSGDLERGYVYEYDNFYLNTAINITGTGPIAVLVSGDLLITQNAQITSTITEYKREEIDVQGNTYVGRAPYPENGAAGTRGVGGTCLGVGAAGQNGALGAEALNGKGGAGGAGGHTGQSGAGCIVADPQPSPGTMGALNGGNGINGTRVGGGFYGLGGGGGGGAASGGDSGKTNDSIIFVVQGNIIIQDNATFVGIGEDGGNGGDGGDGGNGATGNWNGSNTPQARGGTGGGGGDGGDGGDGAFFGFYALGTISATVANLSTTLTKGGFGTAGNGGLGGTTNTTTISGGRVASGADGADGADGAEGSVLLTQL